MAGERRVNRISIETPLRPDLERWDLSPLGKAGDGARCHAIPTCKSRCADVGSGGWGCHGWLSVFFRVTESAKKIRTWEATERPSLRAISWSDFRSGLGNCTVVVFIWLALMSAGTVTVRVTGSIKNNEKNCFLCYLVGMKEKSHARSPEKQGFSVALPKVLIDEINRIAKLETRSRNGQIERFLEDCVKKWKADQAKKVAENLPEPPSTMLHALKSHEQKKANGTEGA